MSPDLKDLIKYRMQRATETLQVARSNFENGYLFETANRCYYAAFYAVSALLLTKDKSSSKHSGIMSLFHSEVVKSGLVTKHDGRFYDQLFKYRMKVDYEYLVELQADDVQTWMKNSEIFVNKINALTTQELSNPPNADSK